MYTYMHPLGSWFSPRLRSQVTTPQESLNHLEYTLTACIHQPMLCLASRMDRFLSKNGNVSKPRAKRCRKGTYRPPQQTTRLALLKLSLCAWFLTESPATGCRRAFKDYDAASEKLEFGLAISHDVFVRKMLNDGQDIKMIHIVSIGGDNGHFVAAKPSDKTWCTVKARAPAAEADKSEVEEFAEENIEDNKEVPETEMVDLVVKYSAYKRIPSVDVHGQAKLDKHGKQTKTLTLDTNCSASPPEFLALFRASLYEYAAHKRLAVIQDLAQTMLLDDFPDRAIHFAADFGENYESFHGVEVQSEYWQHYQVTLFIVIVHRWQDYKHTDGVTRPQLVAIGHVFVSPDPKHDTYFVQHALKHLLKHYDGIAKIEGKTIEWTYISTDGAASHFKSRHTMFSLFDKELFWRRQVMWEVCAPGHGKGPWDGLCACIKCQLRRWEKLGKLHMKDALAVFIALRGSYNRNEILIDGMIKLEIWYVAGGLEPHLQGQEWSSAVLPPVPRPNPANRPKVSALTGIRKSFVFRPSPTTPGLMFVATESHRCAKCNVFKFDECESKGSGDLDQPIEWTLQKMDSTMPASGRSTTRATKTKTRDARRLKARTATVGAYVALQSAGDEDHVWWLAQVVDKAWKHKGRDQRVDNLAMTKDGWYIKVHHFDNEPGGVFKRAGKHDPPAVTIDVEGVIHVFKPKELVLFDQPAVRRSARGHSSTRYQPPPKVRVRNQGIVQGIVEQAELYNSF
jgi:hypothetical protein